MCETSINIRARGVHIFFYKQLDFQFEPGVANGFCLGVA